MANNWKYLKDKHMKQTKKNIKMNLTLNEDFYRTLQDLAERDHLKVSTWTKQFLMRQVDDLLKYEELVDDYPF